MSVITVTEAADILGVSRTAIQHLLASGRLRAAGNAGRTILLDRGEVLEISRQARGAGRAWAARTAWAALALLSGHNVDWLTSTELSRLKRRLRSYDADAVRHLARNRSTSLTFSASESARRRLTDAVVRSGESALIDEAAARSFGLAAGPSDHLIGYIGEGDARRLARAVGLTEDRHGNVVLKEVTTTGAFRGGRTPTAAIAVDLMDSTDTRLASAGRSRLQRLLDDRA